MLWRVGQEFRHLQQAALLLFSVPRITIHTPFLVVQPLHHSIRVQWPPAVAFRGRQFAQQRAGSLNIDSIFLGQRADGVAVLSNEAQPRKVKPRKHPTKKVSQRSEIASMIDAAFACFSLKSTALKKLRGGGESAGLLEHVVDREKARKLAMLMANTTRPKRALQVLILAHALGCKLKQNAYEGVAHELATGRQWRLVCFLVKLGLRHTGRTTVRLLNWRTRALVEIQHFTSLDGVLERFKADNLKPNRRTFHLLISGHIRNRDLARARHYLSAMQEAGYRIDGSTHALIVSVYRSLGPDHAVMAQALKVLRDVDNRSATIVLNSLIQLSLDSHDMPGALRFLSMCNQPTVDLGQPPDLGENITREGGDVTQRLTDPLTPLGSQQECSPPISLYDAATFTILINHLARECDLSRALQVFRRMNAAGVQPDSGIAAALVRAHFAGGQAGVAVRIVADMCKGYGAPHALFHSIGLVRAPPDGLSFHLSRVPPTTVVFNALLQGVLETHGLNGMRVVQHIMRTCGVRFDEHTIHIFLSYLSKVEDARPREIIRLLKGKWTREITTTLQHLHAVMRPLLRREKKLLRYSNQKASTADVVQHRANVLSAAGKISGVAKTLDPSAGIAFPRATSYRALLRPVLHRLRSHRVRSDKATFAFRIKHDAIVKGDLEMARRSFQAMIDRGIHPNEYHFAALMEGYAQAGQTHQVMELMRSAAAFGIHPNVKMYTILIAGYAGQGRTAQALRVFRDMITEGIKPDVIAVDVLIQGYLTAGAFMAARRVLLHLWPTIADFPAELQQAPLKELVRRFRSLNQGPRNASERLSKQRQRMLRWKVKKLAEYWKRRNPSTRKFRFGSKPRHVSNRAIYIHPQPL
ncbi:hypothetical protein AcW2_000693 [Taiwanofungus camphoratus]|nr:hypothetical protein AcW2_000693 [Antrodia cinnamomea]